MMIPYRIVIGEKDFEVIIEGKKIDGQIYLDTKSLMEAQKKLAHSLVLQTIDFNKDIFNFLMDVSGYKASKIAKLTKVTPACLSKYRRTETDEQPSSMFWQLFRIVMFVVLSEGNIDGDIGKIINLK